MYDSSVPEDVKKKVAKWTELAKKHGLTLPQVALNFAFLPEIVDFVAFGTSRAKAVDENLELCGNTVPLALWAEEDVFEEVVFQKIHNPGSPYRTASTT